MGGFDASKVLHEISLIYQETDLVEKHVAEGRGAEKAYGALYRFINISICLKKEQCCYVEKYFTKKRGSGRLIFIEAVCLL